MPASKLGGAAGIIHGGVEVNEDRMAEILHQALQTVYAGAI